jgi:hypothetical protein
MILRSPPLLIRPYLPPKNSRSHAHIFFEADQLKPLSNQYHSAKIYSLDGNQFICDTTGGGLGGAHSDIAKPEVAHAIWQAVLASST